MKNVFSLIFCLLLLNSAEAQFRISGKIVSSEEGLPGAHIWKKGDYNISDVSDHTGRFALGGLTVGDTLICSFVGFKEQEIVVSGKETNVLIRMKPHSQQLKSVEVKASVLGAENFAFEKLQPLDIYLNPNSKADALIAINTQMSSTTKDENAAVAFRGASPQQTGYFLNGVPIKNPVKYAQLTNTGTLSIFNTDFLKSATVFAGNPPVEYGQATSGAIVLELADRFPDYWQHTASVSMANIGLSSRGQIGDKSYLGVFANYQFDEFLKGVNSRNFENINSFNALEGGMLFTTHQKWGSVKIYQYGLSDAYNFNFKHPSYHDGFIQDSKRSLTTIQWVQEFGHWQASLVAGNSWNRNGFQFGNMAYHLENYDPYSSANLTYTEEGVVLKSGYAYWGQHSTFDGQVPEFDYALSPEHPSLTIRAKDNLESHEYYLYSRKKWGSHALGSGIRTAYLPTVDKQLWSYQLNYSWDVGKRLKLIAGHGKYYQSRLNTTPQVIEQFQTGIDIDYRQKKWAIHQSFFQNLGEVSIWGAESRVSLYTSTKFQIDQSASLYYQNDKWDWFTRTFFKYNPVPGWSFNASMLAFRGDTYRTVNNARYISELEVFAPMEQSIPHFFEPYRNFSLGANKLFQFSENLSGIAFVNVANLFDFKNENSISYTYDYSSFKVNHLTRRSIYAGIIFNLVAAN